MSQMASQLGLDDDQKKAIESGVREIFSAMRSQFQGGGANSQNGDGNSGQMKQRRAQMRAQVAAVFREHLSAEQYEKYEQIQRQATDTRQGLLWIQSDDGIRPVTVRLGISDENHTQVISKDLSQGDVAVTRIRRARN